MSRGLLLDILRRRRLRSLAGGTALCDDDGEGRAGGSVRES